MKRFKKIALIIVSAIVLGVVLLLAFLKFALPTVGEPRQIQVEITPDKIERGRYLANNVMVCMDCHSKRNWKLFSGPPVPGTNGQGGEVFNRELGFPGRYLAPNITPSEMDSWSDGELFRAITMGVSKEGDALFPVMPYKGYGKLSENDIRSVIAYIRSLDPIENKVGESKSDFPMNFIINTLPEKASLSPIPQKSDKIAYGKYLVTAAACGDCHTNQEGGKKIGKPFAGGREFKFPSGDICRAANITSHASGIGNWSEQQFITRFKNYSDSSYTPREVSKGEFQTIMPWTMYSGMKIDDLKAMYAYLQTLEPAKNQVNFFSPKDS